MAKVKVPKNIVILANLYEINAWTDDTAIHTYSETNEGKKAMDSYNSKVQQIKNKAKAAIDKAKDEHSKNLIRKERDKTLNGLHTALQKQATAYLNKNDPQDKGTKVDVHLSPKQVKQAKANGAKISSFINSNSKNINKHISSVVNSANYLSDKDIGNTVNAINSMSNDDKKALFNSAAKEAKSITDKPTDYDKKIKDFIKGKKTALHKWADDYAKNHPKTMFGLKMAKGVGIAAKTALLLGLAIASWALNSDVDTTNNSTLGDDSDGYDQVPDTTPSNNAGSYDGSSDKGKTYNTSDSGGQNDSDNDSDDSDSDDANIDNNGK